MEQTSARLRPYVPGFAVDWARETPSLRHRSVTGTLAFVDVSGFTRLTERLARRGKVGAEELTELLDATFARLLEVAYAHGAWLVKWGGDAVLLLFQGDGHAVRGCTAAVEMRRALERSGPLATASGPVRLRLSTGVHSGTFDAFLVGSSHRELVLAGPDATTTAQLEAAASPGQVAVSGATAALLPPGLVHEGPGGVLLLHRSPGAPPQSPLRAAPTGPPDLTGSLAGFLAGPVVTHLLLGDDEPEHRLVSVAFVEFSGLDGLLAVHGPEAATDAVEAVVRTCQEAATRHGVVFWESDIGRDGGKVMLVAGAPGSSGADEDAVLAVARDVVEGGGALQVRVGVNCGRVFFGQFGPAYRRTLSVKGDAVNLAARLMARAGPGQVLASTAVLDGARTPYELVHLPPFLVKGRQAPVTAATVGPPRSRAAQAHGDATPLVGRARELALLQEQWALAAAGSLRAWELVGPPGAGTSRLVRALAATTAAPVVELRCDPHTATTAHLPLRRALRSLLGLTADAARAEAGEALTAALAARAPELQDWAPLLATVLDADVPPTAAASALDERFAVRRQQEATTELLLRLLPGPTLLVVDDAHLLDPSSASLLDHLAEHARQAPWLVLRCGRARAPESSWEQRLEVLPLDDAAGVELAHALADDAPLARHETEALVRRAGGSPLFLTELVRATGRGLRLDELPGSVEALLAAQVDRLPPADRRLLRAAAVVGREVDLDVLSALSQRDGGAVDAEALSRLQAFLEPTGPRTLRFRQALLHEVAYEGLAYRRRTVLHGHVGEVLLERSGADAPVDDAVLSLHFLRSQRPEQAWRHARRAALRAHAVNAHAEAAELDERALLAAERARPPDDEVARAWEDLGDARYRLGQFPDASQAYAEARRRLRTAPVDAARLHLRSALCAERSGAYRQALRWLTTGDRLLAEGPDRPEVQRLSAELAVARATVRHWQGRHRDALVECRRAVALADAVGASDVVAESLVWEDVSELMLGEGDGSAARRALALLQQRGDRPWQLGRCLNEIGIRAWYAGDWDAATRSYRACRDAFAEAGDAWAAAQASANEAEVLSDQGHWDEAEPLLRDALRAGRTSHAPGFVAFVLALLGRRRARTGADGWGLAELRRARASYAAIGETAEVADADARPAEALALSGDAEAALAMTTALSAGAAAVPPLLLRVRGLALLRLGDLEGVRAALEAAREAATTGDAPHEAAYALHALAAVHACTGPVPDDLAAQLAAATAALGIVRIAGPAGP